MGRSSVSRDALGKRGEEGRGNGWFGFGRVPWASAKSCTTAIMTHLDIAYVNDCALCAQIEKEPDSSHFPMSSDWSDTHIASTAMRYM